MSSSRPHPISDCAGIGPKRLAPLVAAGMHTAEDVFFHLPRRYIDRTKTTPFSEFKEQLMVTLKVKILKANLVPGKKMRFVAVGQIEGQNSTTEEVDLIFFNKPQWMTQNVKVGDTFIASGKLSKFKKWQIIHPELEKLVEGEEMVGKIATIYSLSEDLKKAGLDQKGFRKLVDQVLAIPDLNAPEDIPEKIRTSLGLKPKKQLLATLHKPSSLEEAYGLRKQLKLREILPVSLRMAFKRKQLQTGGCSRSFSKILRKTVENALPFTLTSGQKQALQELETGFASGAQFQALLQGDVGSGKTAIALLAAVDILESGAQCAILAPTEILAQQHQIFFSKYLNTIGERSALITGSTPTKQRREATEALQNGSLKVVIGTHALMSADVIFANLGLVIVDEQHRFGVGQRALLMAKGQNPELLAMSATPIPRSLVMSLYGDLQAIVLNEKPPGRKEIRTRLLEQSKRAGMMKWTREQALSQNRCYWIVPRVEEEGTSDLESVESIVAELCAFDPTWKVGGLHGRLKDEEKNQILDQFRVGEIEVLVSTTVVEVGVNVPEANVIVIEGADRFGLAQLHQLRGRVGRGSLEAWCFLICPESPETIERLNQFCQTEDGFAISELDLSLRGPGNLEGLDQSGSYHFDYFDFMKDMNLIEDARDFSEKFLRDLDMYSDADLKIVQEWLEPVPEQLVQGN